MIFYKCDRCGKTYTGKPKYEISLVYNPDGSKFDLCNECLDGLKEWLFPKKEDDTDDK